MEAVLSEFRALVGDWIANAVVVVLAIAVFVGALRYIFVASESITGILSRWTRTARARVHPAPWRIALPARIRTRVRTLVGPLQLRDFGVALVIGLAAWLYGAYISFAISADVALPAASGMAVLAALAAIRSLRREPSIPSGPDERGKAQSESVLASGLAATVEVIDWAIGWDGEVGFPNVDNTGVGQRYLRALVRIERGSAARVNLASATLRLDDKVVREAYLWEPQRASLPKQLWVVFELDLSPSGLRVPSGQYAVCRIEFEADPSNIGTDTFSIIVPPTDDE